MVPRCIPSKFSTSLESNTIYLGQSLQNKYNCPDSLCAESGSFSRPAQKFSQVIEIIEKNYKDIPVSLSIFSGIYKEEDITEYKVPSNLVSIYSHSSKTTTLFGNFSFSNSIEIKNITLEGFFRSSENTNIKIDQCIFILPEIISLVNQSKVEFFNSTIFGSILYKNNLLESTILYKNCNLESTGNKILSFELENSCQLSCSIQDSFLQTTFSSGILKTMTKDESFLNFKIVNSNIVNKNEENYSMDLLGEDTSNTKFVMVSCSCYSKCNFMYQNFLHNSNKFYILENNNFELENQMHHKELIHDGIYDETIKNNTFSYINQVPLNKPLCSIIKKGGKYIRNMENNTIQGKTYKGVPLVLKTGENAVFDSYSRQNTITNNGNGDGLVNNYNNCIKNHIGTANILNIKFGKSCETNLLNNSQVNSIRENILMEGHQGIIMNTDDSSKIEHTCSNFKYKSTELMDKGEHHNKFNGNIKNNITSSMLTVKNSDKNIIDITGGEHGLSNTFMEHHHIGDILSLKDCKVLCSTSNLLSNEGSIISMNGNSGCDLNSTQVIRKGQNEKSMIKQEDTTQLEVASSNLSNTIGHCIEKLGNNTNTLCNAIKTKINENFNILEGKGTFTQSSSQCLLGSSTTNTSIQNVPSSVTN